MQESSHFCPGHPWPDKEERGLGRRVWGVAVGQEGQRYQPSLLPGQGCCSLGLPDIERVRLMQRKGKQDEGLVPPSVGAASSHLRPPEALALVEGSHLGRFRLSFISWQKVAWSLT